MRSTLTSKGQITIPKEVREQLGLNAGCRFDFHVDLDGRIIMVPLKGKLEDIIGMVPKRVSPPSVEEIDRAIVDAVMARAARGR